MELWIRSQDKENLIRSENLCYFNACNEMESIGKNYILNKSYIGDKDCIVLGEYKSKERALEVLDEIQEFIEKQGQTYLLTSETGFITGQKHYGLVYEMPKE